MSIDIGILGAGRFAKEIEVMAKRFGLKVVDFFDGTKRDAKILQDVPYCIGVGYPQVKRLILKQSGCTNFISIYDPDIIHDGIVVGKGCVISQGVFLTVNVILGDFVTLGINCTIGHDCRIGNLSTVSPGANVSGNINIGEGCFIGTGAAIREKLSICDDVTLGLNSAVVKNIGESGVYVGVPARKIK